MERERMSVCARVSRVSERKREREREREREYK